MKVIENEKVIFCDVDDTLVMWNHPNSDNAIYVTDPNDGMECRVVPHKFHIDLLKKHAGRGYNIVVWSQGGYAWAAAVVKELGLDNYVDFVMTKPIKYIDDLACKEWMGQHLYFEDLRNE